VLWSPTKRVRPVEAEPTLDVVVRSGVLHGSIRTEDSGRCGRLMVTDDRVPRGSR